MQATQASKLEFDPNLILFREAKDNDYHFIYQTWINGSYFGNRGNRIFDRLEYRNHVSRLIKATLEKKTAKAIVACLKDDQDVLLGYAVTETDCILHFTFVKPEWRELGIASKLMPQAETVLYSHKTDALRKTNLTRKPGRKFIYAPYLFTALGDMTWNLDNLKKR